MAQSINDARPEIVIFDRKMREEKQFWLNRLSDEIGDSSLRLDHARPAVYSDARSVVELTLDDALYQSLSKLTNDGPFLIYTTLLTTLQICLHKYTGSRRIAIGSPSLKENDDPSQPPNMVAIVGDIDDRSSFRQLLINTRQTLIDAYAKQHYHFSRIAKDLGLEMNGNRCPIFDLVLLLENIHTAPLELRNDIIISFTKHDSSITGSLSFNHFIFEQATIERFAGHYTNVLRSALQNPNALVSELRLLSDAERHEMLVGWNDTQRDYPRDVCVHELFEAQAERTPSAIAVVAGESEIGFGELNRRANQIGHYLRELGVGPETCVGVCLERSAELIATMLGVMKAGGVYVPLDPGYPQERLAFMLEDIAAPVVVTRQEFLARLPEQAAKFVCLDGAEADAIAQRADTNFASGADADNLAYVIYTSGSTGTPKGVAINHASLVNLIEWHLETYQLSPESRMSQVASISFDASVWELWPCLVTGASLHIVDEETRIDPSGLVGWLCAEGITHSFLPTPIAEGVALECWPPRTALKWLMTGGDRLKHIPVDRLPFPVVNHYGPTESTVVATCAPVTDAGSGALGPSIGSPIANTEVYILDSFLQPTPVGVPGELHIGGNQLARGYLNRPELTAERFVPDPFSGRPGARLYRTGDLACYLPDGNIEFLGRFDHQVKVRGFRIELGEIESLLSAHRTVRESVVVTREDDAGDKRLVAYLVKGADVELTANELRSFLKERLPDYMIPTAFVMLDALPLTSAGKVDRRALPAPETTRQESANVAVAPRTPTEEVLAGIWAEVLRLEQVGIHDNFFHQGGHSLKATQAISRVRDAFRLDLPLRAIFEAATVAELARHIDKELRASQQLLSPPLAPATRDGAIPLSFAQQRVWFLNHLEPNSSFYNIAAAVRLEGHLNRSALERTLNHVMRRHEALRTVFAVEDGTPAQIIVPDMRLNLDVTDLRDRPQAEQEAEALRMTGEEARQPFDLAQGPLVRARLLRLGDTVHVLMFTMHHIVSDGWSMGILIREVATLYEAFSQQRGATLPELPVQYADFAIWQREWLQGERLETQLAYWKKQLGGAPLLLEIPTDRPRPVVQTYRGARHSIVLSDSLSADLKAMSRREGATLFMIVLAAFKVLLSRYSRQTDIVVGSPIANRNRAELEGLIGFFVNTLVLRTDLSGDPSFRELLGRVREMTLSAYVHQDLPFEKLVEELQPERSLSRSPLFQVMFAVQNAPREVLELPGLTLTLLDNESSTAKFDITASLVEFDEQIACTFEYNTDLFDSETPARMLRHFEALLQAAAADAEQRVGRMPLLLPTEREQLVSEWNQTERQFTSGKRIDELFQAQAERTPDRAAVVFGHEEVSYRELNNRANQLARYLRGLGVGPDVPVCVCMERNVEMIVALLAVLKAGGAYVPIDPRYPKLHTAFMIQDAKAQVVLTQRHLSATLPESGARVVCVDDAEWIASGQTSSLDLAAQAIDANLAYVIYTSGSTGRPKGVAIEHRSTVTFLQWAQENFSAEELKGVLASTSICFDLSVFELFAPLSWGGTVILAENALQLAATPAGNEVTLINTVPSAMAELVRRAEVPSSVRAVNLAGEALQARLVEQVYQQQSGCRVLNLYGPSEDTTYSTFTVLERESQQTPSIGKPVANTQAFILDGELEPVPVGVVGELYLGGAGLARGYLDRPELTAEKFIPDPFSRTPGARLYKTGDLARYQANSQIDFLGRLDQQVKVRGYRVEVGEVEAALRTHEAVRETAVAARRDAENNYSLVAYIVAGREDLSVSELRAFLKERLPDYLLPSAFVMLASLPQTPNGKVDRRALPEPDHLRPKVDSDYVAPRTELEQMIAGVWREVLSVDKVGIHDNFFDLGGHSLLTVRVQSRLKDLLGREMSIIQMFMYPTVGALARHLTEQRPDDLNIEGIRRQAAKRRSTIEGRKRALKSKGKGNE